MKMNNTKSIIAEATRISSRMPKSIKESLNFNSLENEGDDDAEMMDNEPMSDESMDNKPMEHRAPNTEDIDVDSFIATMRKNSLKIMAKLSDDPENPIYDFSKKVFQLAEKAYSDQKGKSDMGTDYLRR